MLLIFVAVTVSYSDKTKIVYCFVILYFELWVVLATLQNATLPMASQYSPKMVVTVSFQ